MELLIQAKKPLLKRPFHYLLVGSRNACVTLFRTRLDHCQTPCLCGIEPRQAVSDPHPPCAVVADDPRYCQTKPYFASKKNHRRHAIRYSPSYVLLILLPQVPRDMLTKHPADIKPNPCKKMQEM